MEMISVNSLNSGELPIYTNLHKKTFSYKTQRIQVCTLGFCTLVLCLLNTLEVTAQVVINEVMASNGETLVDEDGDYPDWIELYNAGIHTINLGGYALSDDYGDPMQWIFPDVYIEPGSFLLVFASGKDRYESELHTNFRIDLQGEEIILVSPDGTWLDELPPTPIPRDISFGRQPDGGNNWLYFDEPTPGAPNSTQGHSQDVSPPIFSHQSGFYQNPFNLQITSDDELNPIYYTLDGSEPTSQDFLYENAIAIVNRTPELEQIAHIPTSLIAVNPIRPILKATVVRARAINQAGIASPVITHTYFVDAEIEHRHELPIFSLVTDAENLFDYEYGIYLPGKLWDEAIGYPNVTNPYTDLSWVSRPANYHERGSDWERPAALEFFEPGGNSAFNIPVGIRIHGTFSRIYPQKSLRLYTRNSYGLDWLEYPLFGEQDSNRFKRFLLRNSGSDWTATMMRDGVIQDLLQGLNIDKQAYRPTVLYINGEYWGIHNLRERLDRYYLSEHYNIDPDRIDMLEYYATVIEGDNWHMLELLDYLRKHDLSNQENMAYIETQIDIDSYIDYQIAQIYVNNTDWPSRNLIFWRYQQDDYDSISPRGQDGRWRWILYDLDEAFAGDSDPEAYTRNTLAVAAAPDGPEYPNPPWSTFIFRKLLENYEFQLKFINRFADLLNTQFDEDHVVTHINEGQATIRHEIVEHMRRWNVPFYMEYWEGKVNDMRTFARERPDYIRQHLQDFFSSPDLIDVSIEMNLETPGMVRLNTLYIHPDNTPWTGTYFQNIPLNVTALPGLGLKFSTWNQSQNESVNITPIPESDLSLKPVFAAEQIDVFENQISLLLEQLGASALTYTHFGLPIDAALALTHRVGYEGVPGDLQNKFKNTLQSAYFYNLQTLHYEPTYPLIKELENVIAAWMLLGPEAQNSLRLALDAIGHPVFDDYGWVFLDQAENPVSAQWTLANGEEISELDAAQYPFGGAADLDQDGFTNHKEYINTLQWSGSIEDFVEAALNPDWDGSNPEEEEDLKPIPMCGVNQQQSSDNYINRILVGVIFISLIIMSIMTKNVLRSG